MGLTLQSCENFRPLLNENRWNIDIIENNILKYILRLRRKMYLKVIEYNFRLISDVKIMFVS